MKAEAILAEMRTIARLVETNTHRVPLTEERKQRADELRTLADRLEKALQEDEERKRRQAFAYGLIMTARNVLGHAENVVAGDKDIRKAHAEVVKVLEKYEKAVLDTPRWEPAKGEKA